MLYALPWYLYLHGQVVETVALVTYGVFAVCVCITILLFGILYILASWPYSHLKLIVDLAVLGLTAQAIGLLWPAALAAILIATIWPQRRKNHKWQLWPRAA